MFPWKGLGAFLLKHRIRCRNWPEGVRFPGEADDRGSVAKSLSNIKMDELRRLLDSLSSEQQPLFLVRMPDQG